jgi:Tol biopolymer transport system component/DNA-binding winged helix-turn-helix (wHTH) protein/TolB-like protein
MAKIYQFGKFVLDAREQVLTADGLAIHLPTKEFETLLMLVENNGKVVSKDEMMSAIWKDTFVEESNLAQYVSRLRKVLNVDGNQYIKTISKRGYRFSADVKTSDGDLIIERHLRVKFGGRVTRGLGEINSVAVLPFQSLGSPADAEFFGLGIADALITQLTRTGTIITRPTASVLKFRSPDQDPVAIAALLNVDAILQGNFQKSGNRLRLTAQMLHSESGETLWAESFNTEIDDIFDVQDRIAERIVIAFSKQHSAETRGQLTKRYTENKAAYQEYLQGRFNFSKRTADGLTKALKNFETAIEIDPLYALAYAGIAEAYQLLPLSDALEPHAAFPKAKAAVLRALEIDDTIPEAHVSLGVILMDFDWNWRGAQLSFQKAIELNPNYAAAHQVYGTLLLRLGRIGDAILELKKAQLLDPLSPAINTWMGEAFAHLGEHEAAIRIHKETIKFAPEYVFAHYFLVQSYVSTGQLTEAAKAAEDAVMLSDDMSLTRSASIFLKAHIGDREAARKELQGLIEKRDEKYVSAINIASGFAVLKQTDDVFKWLEIAHAERDSNLTWLNIDREFDYLREDPRFRTILQKVNLPDATSSRNGRVSENETLPIEVVGGKADAAIPRKRKRLAKLGLAGAAAVVLGFAGYYLIPFFGINATKQPEKNALVRLTDAPFDDANPTFTRDGQIRFVRFVDKQTLVTYIMNADGTGIREQSEIPGLTSGVWSPDGAKVFYRKGPGDHNFYLANSDGSDERIMPFHPGNCLWSPDSKQFLYQAKARDSSIPNNSDIFVFTLETETIVPVVEGPFFDSDPVFSPDGKSIVYVSDMDGNFEVYSRVIATGEAKRLTNNPGHESFPTYSPDGTQIIFNSDGEKENNDVYLMNVDGSNVRKITDAPGWDASPPNNWSPDGTQVLLLSDRGGKENIYVMNIEPFAPRRIASNVESDQPLDPSYSPGGDQVAYQLSNEIRIFDASAQTDKFVLKTSAGANPTFSPDGRRILFQERIDENTEICSVNVDGSDFVNITQSPSKDISPAYSPDGTRIAFAANRAAGTISFEIYVMNSDGSEQKLFYGDRAMSVGPSWAPDGRSLVFANDREGGRVGNFELFSINVDGGTEKRLTNRPRYDSDPTFSPDGTRIAFASNADGNWEIYVMNTDGSAVLRLTRDLGSDLFPHWSPDGEKLIFTSNRTGKYAIYEIDL